MALTQAELDRILGKQSVVQRAFEANQPTVSAQRPSSPSLSAISNVLDAIRKPLDVYGLNKNIPVVGGTTFADVTGLNQVAPLTQDIAYGRPVMRGGSLQTMQADPRLAGLVDFIPAAGVAAKAGQVGAKAGAREIARQIETGTGAFGKGTIDPRQYITAYHGTPHEIVGNKFDLEKVGTGHGASSYGHGAYSSSADVVAKDYKNNLSGWNTGTQSILKRMGGNIDSAINEATRKVENYKNIIAEGGHGALDRAKSLFELSKKQLNDLQSIKAGIPENKGNLYKLDIADETLPYYLNWNKPYHEQTIEVQKILGKSPYVSENVSKTLLGYGKGEDIYNSLVNAHQLGKISGKGSDLSASQKAASEYLNNLGIKGNIYKDPNFNVENYVSFDPKTIKLLERNGLLLP